MPVVYDLMDEPYLFVRPSQRERYRRLHQLMLARTDLLEYFTAMLAELNPTLQKRTYLKTLRAGLEEIRVLIDMPEGKPFEPAQVKSIYEKSSALVTLITKN